MYKRKSKDDNVLIEALQELVSKHPAIGFWKCYYRLRRKGIVCNHKRLYRVYKLLKLNVRRRMKKRLPQTRERTVVGSHCTEPGLEHGLCERLPGRWEKV